jgi:hypothetical protein
VTTEPDIEELGVGAVGSDSGWRRGEATGGVRGGDLPGGGGGGEGAAIERKTSYQHREEEPR